MTDYGIFDQLPAELLHTLFTYFFASELFLTFYNINDYVNATLQSYSIYQLDLKSHFRRICRYVHPEQVISLILSDSNDTPGLSELFFSRF
jgi:phage-related holin